VYLTIGDSHLKELKSLILRIVRPTGNKQSGKFVKSDDLRAKHSKEIRALQRRELSWLIGHGSTLKSGRKREESPEGSQPELGQYISRPIPLRAR
jgi:hypothetical protein